MVVLCVCVVSNLLSNLLLEEDETMLVEFRVFNKQMFYSVSQYFFFISIKKAQ